MGEFKTFGKQIQREVNHKMKLLAHTSHSDAQTYSNLAQLFTDYVVRAKGELDHTFTQWIALDRSLANLTGPDDAVDASYILTLSQSEKQNWLATQLEDLKESCAFVLADAKRWNREYERSAMESQRWEQYAKAAACTRLPPQVEWVMLRIASKQFRIAGVFQKESQIAQDVADRFRQPLLELKKALDASV